MNGTRRNAIAPPARDEKRKETTCDAITAMPTAHRYHRLTSRQDELTKTAQPTNRLSDTPKRRNEQKGGTESEPRNETRKRAEGRNERRSGAKNGTKDETRNGPKNGMKNETRRGTRSRPKNIHNTDTKKPQEKHTPPSCHKMKKMKKHKWQGNRRNQ